MTAALSVDSFAELVQRSRLLSADQVKQVLQELEAAGSQVDTPEALADAFLRRDLLTSWQVGFLLKGKHSGFFLGSYRFLKMLGKGGMGAVYLAEHQMMRRRCAIKVLPTKLISESSSVLDRFYLEAQAVAALDDPNIVRAYDVNKEMQGKREIHYLVMEYVDGCDLQVLVQRKGPLDYIQVADFTRQAASGLAHAHESGLIHRDIKPANLLIDERGTVKILDLGLARFFDDRLDASLTTTHNESILGTADYLSPEQALDSHNVDTRTDIYSLGCTCYYMLTGHPPFPEGSVAQRLMSHQSKSPKAIEKIRKDAPTDLVTIVEKMIAKSPDNRYQSAREVADACAAWLAKHADEGWKEKHRDVIDGSASHARREPTRSRSAATEETDLELGLAVDEELGLAPTEEDAPTPSEIKSAKNEQKAATLPNAASESDLGLDQLEVLDPLTTALDTGSPSGGLDNLLNEALDNYPAFDSNPNLAAASLQTGMASGIHGVGQPAPAVVADPNQIQLFKLIAIGFAVSVPLAIVILVVSSRFSPSDYSQASVERYGETSDESSESADELVSEQPQPSPPTPIAEERTSVRTEDSPPQIGANTEKPERVLADELPPEASEMLPAESPPKSPSETPSSTTKKPEVAVAPPGNTNPPTTAPAEPKATTAKTPAPRSDNHDDQPEMKKSEPRSPSAEQIKELLAGLSVVTVKLDRVPKNSYDLMVVKTAEEALQRAGLKVTSESQEDAAAILTLSFEARKADSSYIFNMDAELKYRGEDSHEISVWKQSEEVAQLKASVLGNTPPSVLRSKVAGFYGSLVREYRQAVAKSE
ncbi:MAG: protein kinase [Planctomycetaceae bacterium]|nr:protein kinase [Planctomycetales bacterium]MCB9940343.1 protein kinase [Planctomycetaceae bacterium]